MDVHGPTCARLLEVAIAGSRAERGRFAASMFTVQPFGLRKECGQFLVDAGKAARLAIGPLLRRQRVGMVAAIDMDGFVVGLDLDEPQVRSALEGWLLRTGSLIPLAGWRRVAEPPSYQPVAASLALLGRGWRGEAAFFLANSLVCAVRRHIAVRVQLGEGELAPPTTELPALPAQRYAAVG
jgi:hypothetical protein